MYIEGGEILTVSINSTRESEYGELYKSHQFEQYKMFVSSAEKISEMRFNSNKFFITINSLIVTLFGIFLEKLSWAVWIVPFLGIGISLLWVKSIKNYSDLNSAKFRVINKIEDDLPLDPYNKEWDILKNNKKYKTLSHTEQYIPCLFIIAYIILFFI